MWILAGNVCVKYLQIICNSGPPAVHPASEVMAAMKKEGFKFFGAFLYKNDDLQLKMAIVC